MAPSSARATVSWCAGSANATRAMKATSAPAFLDRMEGMLSPAESPIIDCISIDRLIALNLLLIDLITFSIYWMIDPFHHELNYFDYCREPGAEICSGAGTCSCGKCVCTNPMQVRNQSIELLSLIFFTQK